MNAENPQRQYFPALDGLRGVAILLVLLFHNFSFITDFFFLGQLGVDLFFVLSGFLITDILLGTINTKNYFKNFYARRVLRIFPVYYLSLILFLLVLPTFFSGIDIRYYSDNQVFLWTYLQNWLYVFKDPAPNNLLLPLWSLAVEEQFYLLWPLAIIIFKKPKRTLLFITITLLLYISAKFFFWEHPVSPARDYGFFIYTRIDGICIGCIVALLRQINPGIIGNVSLKVLVLVIIVNLAYFFTSGSPLLSYQYLSLLGFTSFSIIFGLVINKIVSAGPKKPNPVLNHKPLRFLGKISYGIYIWHLPVYLITLSFFFPRLKNVIPEQTANLIISIFSAILILLIAWLSYNYFEKYFLTIKKKFA